MDYQNNNYCLYKDVKSVLIRNTCEEKKYQISILVPTYKRVVTLKQTIESCINQLNYFDYNIIVCDNNPERGDETELYIHSLVASNIKYFKNERGIGMYGNINRLYELSDGEYSVCIHDDDILLPHFLYYISQILKKRTDIDIMYTKRNNWHENRGEAIPVENLSNKSYIRKLSVIDFLKGNPFPPTGFIAKTESMIKIGGFDENKYPSSDYYFNVYSIKLLNVFVLEQPLFIYRWSGNTTLKLETLTAFIEKDLPLIKELATTNILTTFFKSYYIFYHSMLYINMIKSLYPKFDLVSISSIVKTHYNKIEKGFYFIMSYLWKIIYMFYKFIKQTRIEVIV